MKFNKISFLIHLRIAVISLLHTLVGFYWIFDEYSFIEVLGMYGFPTTLLISFIIDCDKKNQNNNDNE